MNPNVELIHLPVNYYEYDWKSRLHSIYSGIVKKRIHKKELQKAIDKIKPDIIIGVGQAEKYLILKIKTNAIRIRELHFNSNYRLQHAFSFRDKCFALIANLYDFSWAFPKYDKVVILT